MTTWPARPIDGDKYPDVKKKYGVTKLPSLKFVTADEKELSAVEGAVNTAGLLYMAKSALDQIGPAKWTEKYGPIGKLATHLEKKYEKRDFVETLKTVAALEEAIKATKLKHSSDLRRAKQVKAKIKELAKKQMEEAKALEATNKRKAKELYIKVAKAFRGLETAEEAKKRADKLEP